MTSESLNDRPFSPTSFWNMPVSADAPLDPASPAYVAELQAQVSQTGAWVNTTSYSDPVYDVSGVQPMVHVTLDNTSPDPQTSALRQAIDQVPIPANAQPAGGTDRSLIIRQAATDTMWEFWGAADQPDGWHARWGGRIEHMSSSPGYYVDHPQWGSTATSLPALGGLIRIAELRVGHIDHALSVAIPQVRAGTFVWPAQRSDGTDTNPAAIPEGTRLRLDPALNLNALALPRMIRMMAEAAQRYGIVVQNRSSNVAFAAEDPTPTHEDPYGGATGFFDGKYPSALLGQFPWSHLQVLAVPAHPSP